MKKSAYVIMGLGFLIAAGCNHRHPDPVFNQQLEVQLLSLAVNLGTGTIAAPTGATATGVRSGDNGQFSVSSPGIDVIAAACPLAAGAASSDPYGGGGGDDTFNGGVSDLGPFDESGDGSDGGGTVSTAIRGIDCDSRALSICQSGGCVQFAPSEVTLQITDGVAWRQVEFNANGVPGVANLAVRYRERH